MILASRRVRQETLKWEASLFYTDCFNKTKKNNSNKNDDILPSRSITPLPSTIVSQV